MKKSDDNESGKFTISRVFDAPCDLVFKMWTDPNHIRQWLAPGGMPMHYRKADIRPNGMAHYYMEMPTGKLWGKVLYKEIIEPTKLVYVQSFSDENEGPGFHPLAPTWPREMLTTVIFEQVEEKTKIILTWEALSPTEIELQTFNSGKQSMNQGWSGSFKQFEDYLIQQKRA